MTLVLEKQVKAVPFEEALNHTGGKNYIIIISLTTGLSLFTVLAIILCPSYVIPAAECDLNLSFIEKDRLASASFLGMILSSHLVGYFADTYGRRAVSMRCCFMSFILLTFSCFANDATILFVIWLLNGLMVAGIITPIYVYVSEFSPFDFRANALFISSAVASLASAYQPGLAWVLLPMKFKLDIWGLVTFNSWRLFVLLTALLPFVCGCVLFCLPESPKFLLSVGKEEKSLAILKKMYSFNTQREKQEFQVKAVCLDSDDAGKSNSSSTNIIEFLKSLYSSTVELFTPPLLIYTVITSAIQFGVVGIYNVYMMRIPDIVNKVLHHNEHGTSDYTVCQVILANQLPANDKTSIHLLQNDSLNQTHYNVETICLNEINTNMFITNLTIGVMQFVIFLVASSLTNFLGRKQFIVANLMLTAVCGFMLTVVTLPYLIFTCMGVSVIVMSASLPVAMSFTVDFFPTYIRSMGACMCMVFGRIGVAVGNLYFGFIQQIHCNTAYYTVSALTIGITIMCIFLPIKKV